MSVGRAIIALGPGRKLTDCHDRLFPTYCVENVGRQRFQELSDVQPFHDRSIGAVNRQDFCPQLNVTEFFNTIDPKQTKSAVILLMQDQYRIKSHWLIENPFPGSGAVSGKVTV